MRPILLLFSALVLGTPATARAQAPRADVAVTQAQFRSWDQDRWREGVQLVPSWRMTLGRDGIARASIRPGIGWFRRIRIESYGQPAYIDAVRVTFRNGRSRVITVGQQLWARNRAVVLDLPGGTRELSGITIFGRGRGQTSFSVVGLR